MTQPLRRALNAVPRPDDDAPQGKKTAYATALANEMARDISQMIRERGVEDCQPDPVTTTGGERRIAGGIGAKKVDVSLAREETGLIFAISIKGVYFPDITLRKAKGRDYFAKNLVNRKGDMLAESTTLHKRFPYAVLGGLFFFDHRAAVDNAASEFGTSSTYHRAHRAFSIFSDRLSHADADEKYELFAMALVMPDSPFYALSWAGKPDVQITLDDYITTLLRRVAEVNSDYFEFDGRRLIDLSRRRRKKTGREEAPLVPLDAEEEGVDPGV